MTALETLVLDTTLDITLVWDELTSVVTFPVTVDPVLAPYKVDSLFYSTKPFPIWTEFEIVNSYYWIDVTATLTEEMTQAYWSELLILAWIPAQNTRPSVTWQSWVDTWVYTITLPSKESIDTVITMNYVVSDDDFETQTPLATDTAHLVVVWSIETDIDAIESDVTDLWASLTTDEWEMESVAWDIIDYAEIIEADNTRATAQNVATLRELDAVKLALRQKTANYVAELEDEDIVYVIDAVITLMDKSTSWLKLRNIALLNEIKRSL